MAVAELYAIAAEMRRQGSGGIRNETARVLRKGKTPVHTAMVTSVLAKLPKRGGLNVWVAESRFSYGVRAGQDVVAAVRVGKAGHDLAGLDDGLVIHPFYGNPRMPWYDQGVPPQTISDPIREEGGNQLELAGVVAIELAAEKIISA